MEAQGIVAEAVGLPFSLKRVRIKGAMRFVPAPTYRRPLSSVQFSLTSRSSRLGRVLLSPSARAALLLRSPSSARVVPSAFISGSRKCRPDFSILWRRRCTTMSRGPTCHHVRRRAQRDKGTSGGGGEAICTTCRAFAHPRIAILLGGESAASSFPPEIAATFQACRARPRRRRFSAGDAVAAYARRLACRAVRRHQGRAAHRVGRRRR